MESQREFKTPGVFSEADVLTSFPTRFATICAAHADRLAVVSSRHAWTYAQLARLSNGIAQALIRGTREDPAAVALLFEHDAPAVAAIVGVLQAGMFYGALDPSFPASRNKAMLAKLGARTLICDRANLVLATELAPGDCRIMLYEDVGEGEPFADPEPTCLPDSPFCVLFTSGSTGEPKGVLWTHRLALQRVHLDVQDGGLSAADRHSFLTSMTFPAAVSDLCLALLNGASLHLYDAAKFGGLYLTKWLTQERLTVLRSPIALFRQFVRGLPAGECFPDVRIIGLSGARLLKEDVERAQPHFSHSCRFIHRYTIAEVGVVARLVIPGDMQLDGPVVCAGYAVPGKEVLILDERNRELPLNEMGEIAVRARDLPRYFNESADNQSRYRTDEADPALVVCATGDRGRLLQNGRLEVMGRNDERVKVRGYSVELPVVERALRNLSIVKDAVVMTRPDSIGEMSLIAYVVPEERLPPPAGTMRRLLEAELPAYMLPSAFEFLEALPVTRNGKIDRNALRVRDKGDLQRYAPNDAPRTGTEQAIAAIWRGTLNLQRVAISENFFELGGHSLAAARVVAQLNDMFRVNLPLSSIYDAPTLRELAAAVEKASTASSVSADGNVDNAGQEARRRLDSP